MSDQVKAFHAPQTSPINNDYLFLSYNSRDRGLIQHIQKSLHARGVTTFVDRDRLRPGLPWFDALQAGINNACAMAVFIGKDGLGSWQKREVEFGLERQLREEDSGGKFPVVPVVLPEADLERAPGFLLLNTWVDLRSGLNDGSVLDALTRIVGGDVALLRTQYESLCPYRSLLAFREEDRLFFHGRETFAEELFETTLAHQLVAVVGPSGSGKSSVVQAGLLPLLRRQTFPSWDAAIFTPGKHPFHNLAAALVPLWEADLEKTEVLIKAGTLGKSWENGVPLEGAIKQALNRYQGTGRLLIVVDQFEELFTLTPAPDRLPFLNALFDATAASPITILLTLRADFYSQAISLSRDLSDRIQHGLINIGPMRREELRRAIQNPAELVGLEFEPGLVNRILDHIENQPGSLPLLEFALAELWKKRHGRLLPNLQYDAIGEVQGAISKRADELFENLSGEQQEVSLRLLTRLVRVAAPNEEGSDTRQRVRIRDLDESMKTAAQSFVQARLLVVDRDPATSEETIEIAHEALILRWDRLHELLNQDREFMLWRRRLRLRCSEWQSVGEEDDGVLLQGVALAEAKQWLKTREKDLIDDEKEYIRISSRRDPKSDMWRGRFDMLNYAIVTTSATLLLAFGSATNAHFLISISSLLIAFFLFMEAGYYRLWTRALTKDFASSTYAMGGWEAIGIRLRRNYLWLFAVLAGGWALKVYLHPLPARDFDMFVNRATVGLIPGWFFLLSNFLLYAGLLLLALLTLQSKTRIKGVDRALLRNIDLAEEKTKATQWRYMTNYAVVTISVTLLYVFGSFTNSHFVISISSLFIAFFLFKEAGSYRLWAKGKHLGPSTYTMSWREAVGLCLRRTYLVFFALLVGSWILKVYLHPQPARDFDAFEGRASVGFIPGAFFIWLNTLLYAGLLVFALTTKKKDILQGITLTEAKELLDTTPYAIVSTGATLLMVFGSASAPHFVIPIGSLLIAFFLVRGASYYRRGTKVLTEEIEASAYTRFGWEAVGLRLKRTYLFSFILLFLCWALKAYLHPLPARDFVAFVDRFAVGPVPGWVFLSACILLNSGFLTFVLTAIRPAVTANGQKAQHLSP